MAAEIPRKSWEDVLRVVCASGVLGLRRLWKVTTISKELLLLRDDPTPLGLGSLCFGFASVSEHEEVFALLKDSLRKGDATVLRQILSLQGVAGRYPCRMSWAIDQREAACLKVLVEKGALSVCPKISVETVRRLTPESTRALLKAGHLDPNSWIESVAHSKRQAGSVETDCIQPLLVVVIENSQFAVAEVLLDAGARLDVCEWKMGEARRGVAQRPPGWGAGRAPLDCLVHVVCAERERVRERPAVVGTADKRHAGLRLLQTVAKAADEAGCLEWTTQCRIPNRTAFAETALGIACVLRDWMAARTLLMRGADAKRKAGMREKSELPFLKLAAGERARRLRSRSSSETERDERHISKLMNSLGNAGAHLDRVGEFGRTPLSHACNLGLKKVAETLLDRGVRIEGVVSKGVARGRRRVPLIEAVQCSKSNVALVSLLLERGADPNEVGICAYLSCAGSPLQAAVVAGWKSGWPNRDTLRLVEVLVSHGARCLGERREHSLSLSTVATEVETEVRMDDQIVGVGRDVGPVSQVSPLLIAFQMRDAKLARLLVEKGGADPNAPGKIDDRGKVETPADLVLGLKVGRRRCPEGTKKLLVETLQEVGGDLERTDQSPKACWWPAFLMCRGGIQQRPGGASAVKRR
uniref:Uncharacterized protein n=1 Tax=Chromera velia CCMP2878 TaxID=1169474 RepID=A0A0G4HKC5_9ALVE|eukprot:Cvel_7235.t1-p1 / transcript=Cvel_7235.t1 / gene=Cvel_7235 / organism=Chromera_velia_CCMP2878 / gene_product=hypothetical protein / transcript_product=hypothetical protein / location=Cvel_scaffold373:37926-39845(+) / protein_length=640 / sequence_SO=supercontig / SO=protein_coding / is_pseudo=false